MGQDTEETGFSTETTSGSPMYLLIALAAMAVLGAITFWFVSQRPLSETMLMDEQTRSIIFTAEYRTGARADRLPWADIVKLQHITTSAGGFEIVAIKADAEKVVIKESSKKPLHGDAEHYAQMMGIPLEQVDLTRGFHKTGKK